jgi:uncharacterized membrane protein
MYPPGAPMAVGGYVEKSQAPWAIGLAIVGLFCCGIPSVVGLVLGIMELNAISAGKRPPNNRGLAIAAVVIASLVIVLIILSFSFNVGSVTYG